MKIKFRDSLEPIKRKRTKIIKKEINSLFARHAIGNIKINIISRQGAARSIYIER
jgi:hypothetical protein